MVTDAGTQVKAALERHRQSVESARDTANALAEQRERDTHNAAVAHMGNVPTAAPPDERDAA